MNGEMGNGAIYFWLGLTVGLILAVDIQQVLA